MEQYGAIVVRRPRAWSDIARAYRIEVDGEVVAHLRQNHEERIRLSAGVHRFVARIDWTGSTPVDILVPPEDDLLITVEPAGSVWTAQSRLAATTAWIKVTVTPPGA